MAIPVIVRSLAESSDILSKESGGFEFDISKPPQGCLFFCLCA
jgi:hypothetical protein